MKLVARLEREPVFSRLSILKNAVRTYFTKLQQESGYYADLRLGSGLGALVELADVIQQVEPHLGRYLLTEIDLKLPARTEGRYLAFQGVLRSDGPSSFREKGDALLSALRAACGRADSAFLKINERNTGEKSTFQGETDGYFYGARIDLKPEGDYPMFPRSSP